MARTKKEIKFMVGGQALRTLGHDRHTEDTDYLISRPSDERTFIHEEGGLVDYLNAAANTFFGQIWKSLQGHTGEVATPQAIAELKAYAMVQHYGNRNFAKAAACEYDLKFLAREFGVKSTPIAAKYMTAGQYSEVLSLLK